MIYNDEHRRSLIRGDLSDFYEFIKTHKQYIVFYGEQKPSLHVCLYAEDLGKETYDEIEEYFHKCYPNETLKWISKS